MKKNTTQWAWERFLHDKFVETVDQWYPNFNKEGETPYNQNPKGLKDFDEKEFKYCQVIFGNQPPSYIMGMGYPFEMYTITVTGGDDTGCSLRSPDYLFMVDLYNNKLKGVITIPQLYALGFDFY